jgi:hypothetical protein
MNSGILAILVSTFVVVFLSYFNTGAETFKASKSIFIYLLSFICLVIVFYHLKARAALIGGSLALIIQFLANKVSRNAIFISVAALVIFFAIVFQFIKRDSNSGRILIYKATFSQLHLKDYMLGIGVGKFKANYNQYQAQYFKRRSIDTKEALLAGNGYYLFNDILQFTLELGLLRIICLVTLLVWAFHFFYWQPSNIAIAKAASAGLLCMLITSLFSYPLQVYATLALFCVMLCTYLWFGFKLKSRYNVSVFSKYRNIALTVSAIFAGVGIIALVVFEQKSKQAFELARDGFKTDAEVVYKSLEKFPFGDYNNNFNRAFSFYMRNELDSALIQISKSLSLAYSVEAVKLKADILFEANKTREAEELYKQVVLITPGKMLAREALFNFYLKIKDIENAQYWGNSILQMPIKVPSRKVDVILSRVRNEMSKIQ